MQWCSCQFCPKGLADQQVTCSCFKMYFHIISVTKSELCLTLKQSFTQFWVSFAASYDYILNRKPAAVLCGCCEQWSSDCLRSGFELRHGQQGCHFHCGHQECRRRYHTLLFQLQLTLRSTTVQKNLNLFFLPSQVGYHWQWKVPLRPKLPAKTTKTAPVLCPTCPQLLETTTSLSSLTTSTFPAVPLLLRSLVRK